MFFPGRGGSNKTFLWIRVGFLAAFLVAALVFHASSSDLAVLRVIRIVLVVLLLGGLATARRGGVRGRAPWGRGGYGPGASPGPGGYGPGGYGPGASSGSGGYGLGASAGPGATLPAPLEPDPGARPPKVPPGAVGSTSPAAPGDESN